MFIGHLHFDFDWCPKNSKCSDYFVGRVIYIDQLFKAKYPNKTLKLCESLHFKFWKCTKSEAIHTYILAKS